MSRVAPCRIAVVRREHAFARFLLMAAVMLLAACFPESAKAQTWSLTPLSGFGASGWLSNTTLTSYLVSGSNDRIRSLAFNPSTGNLLFATGTSVGSINAATGAFIAQLDNSAILTGTGVSSGGINRTLSNVSVTSDGVVYGSNLTTNSAGSVPLQIYRWASESGTSSRVYSGNGGVGIGARMGDSLVAVGSDSTGVLALGSGTVSTNAGQTSYYSVVPTALTSGSLSALTAITGTGAASQGFRTGIVAVDSDSFFGLAAGAIGSNVVVTGTTGTWSFDGTRTIQNANERSISTVTNVFGTPLVATMQVGNVGINTVRLYNASSLSTSTSGTLPFLVSALISTGSTTNGNASVGIAFGTVGGNPVLYALNTNNGIQAFQIVPEPTTTLAAGVCTAGLAALMLRRRARKS